MTARTPRWAGVLPALGFLAALITHAGWRMLHAIRTPAWADLAASQPSPLLRYVTTGDVLLGVAYGGAAALALYGVSTMARARRAGAVGAAAGLSLGGLVVLAGCLLVGCCGSPMLAVWAAVAGSKALGMGKFATAGLTLAAVAGGWWWVRRSCRRECRDDDRA